MDNSAPVYESVPLHEHPHFLEPCVEVLREEWARSAASRRSMLEKSSDKLPFSVVLIQRSNGSSNCSEVVGHSRICKVLHDPHAGFVESVVIRKDLRSHGLGRKLMNDTELFAKRLNMTVLYLTTHDKQGFYERLGYDYCQPIVSLGSASGLLSDERLSKLVKDLGFNNVVQCNNAMHQFNNGHVNSPETPSNDLTEPLVCHSSPSSTSLLPPAPPPPPCLSPATTKTLFTERVQCSWMKKQV